MTKVHCGVWSSLACAAVVSFPKQHSCIQKNIFRTLYWRSLVDVLYHIGGVIGLLHLSITCRLLKFRAKPTKCIFYYCQSNVWQLLPASHYCLASGNQIMHSSDNETVLGSIHKLGEPVEHYFLIDGSEKRTCRSTFKFQSLHITCIKKHSK